MPRSFLTCVFTAFVALAGVGEAQERGIPVRGFLVSGGDKVAGATVRLAAAPDPEQRFEMAFGHVELTELARTRSGGDGYFELAAPEAGFYQLQVEADGFLGTDRWVAALGAAPDPVQIELIRARRVHLKVLDAEGRPLFGARLRLGVEKDGSGRYPTWPQFRETGADGSLSFLVPEGQEAAAVLSAPGFALTTVRLPAAKASLEARLERGLPLLVEVADPRRRLLPGVAIFAPEAFHEIGRTGRDGRAWVRIASDQRILGFADAEGRYAIEALPAVDASPPVTAAGEAAEPVLRVVLEERPPIEGQVFELPQRVPLAGAWLSLGGTPPVFARSDRLGFFRLPRVPGRRHLLAAKEGYRSSHAEVGAVPVLLGIALEPAAAVFGSVSDAAGKPVAGAWVTATTESQVRTLRAGGRSRALTDRDGRYQIADLPAGETAELEATYKQLAAKIELEPVAAGERARADLQLPRRVAWRCRVVDSEERPIAGAEVFAAAPRLSGGHLPPLDFGRLSRSGQVTKLGITDENGRLATTELAARSYDIAVRAASFAPTWRRGVAVGGDGGGEPEGDSGSGDPDAAADETIVLEPLLRAFGKVLDENGSGLADASLHLAMVGESGGAYRVGPESPAIATSGAGGEFSFSAVAAGQRFNLIAGKEGYVSAQLVDQMLVEGPKQAPLELRLARAGQVAGTVESDGKPVTFAALQADPLDPPRPGDLAWKAQTRSDIEGDFAIDRLWPGRYRLKAEANGFQPWRSEVFEVIAGERKELDIELSAAALVVGKVLRPSGEPVAEAWLSLADNNTDRAYATALLPTDALGQYRIENAKPGAGWLQATSDRYRRQGRAVEVGPGVNEIDFVLETGSLELAGRVVADDGQPVAGAKVKLYGDAIYREERSGLQGEVRFAELDPGEYRLEPSAPGHLGEAVSFDLKSSREDEIWRLRAARSRILGTVAGLDPAYLAGVRIQIRPVVAGGQTLPVAHRDGYGSSGAAPDSRGRFAIDNLAPGGWLLTASLPDPHRIVAVQVEIGEAEEEKEQDLDFGRLAGPWVGLLESEGAPHSGYFFALSHPQLGLLLQGRGAGSRLELQAEAGTYQLQVFATGASPKVGTLQIEIGAPAEQPVQLARPDS